jgi:hypothetical protein
MEEGADRSSIGVGDDEHPRTMARHNLAGKRIAAQDFMKRKAGVTVGACLGASRPVSRPPVERKRATPSLKGSQVATTFPRPLAANAPSYARAMDLHRRAANNLEEAQSST